MMTAFERLKVVLEPSGAASLAALLEGREEVAGKTILVIGSGGNVRPPTSFAISAMLEADFVIVGSGSAGSALAYRLSEDGRHSVIVIEYGGTDFGPLIQMPSALSIPLNTSLYDWGFSTEPEPHLGGRGWRRRAARCSAAPPRSTAWSMSGGTPATTTTGPRPARPAGRSPTCCPTSSAWRTPAAARTAGAARTGRSSAAREATNPLYAAFIEAGRQAGFELTSDYNGSKQEGFGPMEQTIFRGRRWSTANAYLRPALKRRNVTLATAWRGAYTIENQRAHRG